MKKPKVKKIKGWAVVHRFQKFGGNEQIDCFTSRKLAINHAKEYHEWKTELKIISCEIIIKN